MKVLTVVSDLGIGGTERVAQNLSIGVSRLGCNVAVLAYKGRGPREEQLRASDIAVFGPDPGHTVDESLAAARRWDADIIHIHRTGFPNATETRLLKYLRSGRTKVVETNVFARFDWTVGGSLIDAHCLPSRWCAFKWNAWGGRAAASKRSFILPNPVDISSIMPLQAAERNDERARLGIEPSQFVFGRVGQPMKPKWSPAILDVFAEVLQRHDIYLLLVGAPEEIVHKRDALPAHVRSRVLAYPTTTSDKRLSALFGVMDGFLHMSAIGESFGMVLCEAMLSGVPIVTLSTPFKDNSQLEVVEHGKGGLVALSKDALPAAMIQLMNDHQLRDGVRRRGRDSIAQRFGMEAVSQRAISIYDVLLSSNDNPPSPALDAPPTYEWIYDMLSRGIGAGFTRSDKIAFYLLHNPSIYRAYLTARFWK